MNRSHLRMGRGSAASDDTNAGSESLARVASRLLSARWASINRAAQYSCVGWSSSRCSRPDLARHPLSTGRASSRGSSAPSGEIARDVIDVKKSFHLQALCHAASRPPREVMDASIRMHAKMGGDIAKPSFQAVMRATRSLAKLGGFSRGMTRCAVVAGRGRRSRSPCAGLRGPTSNSASMEGGRKLRSSLALRRIRLRHWSRGRAAERRFPSSRA
jgi:hypothetical protein